MPLLKSKTKPNQTNIIRLTLFPLEDPCRSKGVSSSKLLSGRLVKASGHEVQGFFQVHHEVISSVLIKAHMSRRWGNKAIYMGIKPLVVYVLSSTEFPQLLHQNCSIPKSAWFYLLSPRSACPLIISGQTTIIYKTGDVTYTCCKCSLTVRMAFHFKFYFLNSFLLKETMNLNFLHLEFMLEHNFLSSLWA